MIHAIATMLVVFPFVCPQRESARTSRDVRAAVQAFAKLPRRKQVAALAAVRDAVAGVQGPYLSMVRAYIDEGRKQGKRRAKAPKVHHDEVGRADTPMRAGLEFPVANQYVFGVGQMTAVPIVQSGRKKRRKKTRRPKFPAKPRAEDQLAGMLRGYLPDLDLAFGAMLRDLDRDPGADRFSAFLSGWRNGTESFYRALDRTAGTQEGVFFYDAMLDEFVRNCVPKSSPDFKAIRRDLKTAHDRLHDAFLSYRQYRGMREATALALLLPPDAGFPGVLSRYEQTQSGGYALRDQIDLILRAKKQDGAAVVDLLVSSAPPLPKPLWSKRYDPWPAWQKAWKSVQDVLVERDGTTDKALARARAARTSAQNRVSDAAWGALQGASPARPSK